MVCRLQGDICREVKLCDVGARDTREGVLVWLRLGGSVEFGGRRDREGEGGVSFLESLLSGWEGIPAESKVHGFDIGRTHCV